MVVSKGKYNICDFVQLSQQNVMLQKNDTDETNKYILLSRFNCYSTLREYLTAAVP